MKRHCDRYAVLFLCHLFVLSGCSRTKENRKTPPSNTETAPTKQGARSELPETTQGRRGLERPWELPEHDPDPLDDDLESNYGLALERDGGDDVDGAPLSEEGPSDAYRSFSIGFPNRGRLVGARALLHKGTHHRVLPRTIKRGYFWGTDSLVDLVEQAAQRVAGAHPSSVLQIGNLSSARGGKITTSVSHQSGRDVDIGFFCTDLDGTAANPDGFPVFDGARGERLDRSGQYLLDVARNWTLIEALLTDPKARVQWVFLDTKIKRMLLEYGIRHARDPAVLKQAEKVIIRPKDSSPHNDHIHVRIFCSKRDLNGISSAQRCQEYGPDWTWEKEGRQADEDAVQDKAIRADININDEMKEAPKSAPKPSAAPAPTDRTGTPPTDIEITF